MQKAISVRLEKKLIALLREHKRTTGRNVNNSINIAVAQYLAREYNVPIWQVFKLPVGQELDGV